MKMEIDQTPSPYSDLLSNPGTLEFSQSTRLPEKLIGEGGFGEVTDFSSVRQGRQFCHQYAHTYFIRLSTIRPILKERIHQEWPEIPVKKIAGLCESTTLTTGSASSPKKSHNSPRKYSMTSPRKGTATTTTSSHQDEEHGQHIALREDVTVAIIGTIFKQQPDKPSILQELVEEIQLTDRRAKDKYISGKDVLILEDETTRVRLVPGPACGITVDGVVNGIVLGVKGRPTIDGRFEVEKVIWASPNSPLWPSLKYSRQAEMVFVSGLGFGVEGSESIQLGMLFEHLQGLCGSAHEQENIIRKRNRVFFLGNSLRTDGVGNERFKVAAENSKKLDLMLSSLAQTMEVFVVSGKEDPVEAMYPQPPMHPNLFPKSIQYTSFHLLSNPSRIRIPLAPTPDNGPFLDLIVTDGEPIRDALKFSDVTSGLEMGERFLEWGHLCPTAPDTLPLHPGVEDDVFIIKDKLPNLFLIGNQTEFASREWKGTKIVSVPRFSATATAVALTGNYELCPLQFNLLL